MPSPKNPNPRPAHRPHGCTLEKTEAVCEALARCASIKDACLASGVGPRAYHRWSERGLSEFERCELDPDELPEDWESIVHPDEWIFCVFRQCTLLARAEAHVSLLGTIVDAAPEDWRAAAKLLAIRDPQHYAERKRHEHTGSGGKPIEVQTYKTINLPETGADDDETDEDA